jgi:hypothetical protein
MATDLSVIERAFQLAREGRCTSVAQVRQTLKAERFDAVDAHVSGPSLMKQLNAEIAKHRTDQT